MKKIILLSGDPNSINSELIYKSWKKIPISLKKRIYLITNYNLIKDKGIIVKNIENDTKNFLRLKMYNNKKVLIKNNKGKKVLHYLFKKISKNPSSYFSIKKNKSTIFRQISDYISGMTDRFALNLYNKIK